MLFKVEVDLKKILILSKLLILYVIAHETFGIEIRDYVSTYISALIFFHTSKLDLLLGNVMFYFDVSYIIAYA